MTSFNLSLNKRLFLHVPYNIPFDKINKIVYKLVYKLVYSKTLLKIGSFEAKTKLPELLRMVEKSGEEIIITRKGKEIAKISPIDQNEEAILVIEEIRKLRKSIKKSSASEIRRMIEEGRP